MKQNIFERFNDNKKWKDYINLKSFECKVALLFTLIFLVFFIIANAYDNFSLFQVDISNVTLYIAQALIGVIGVIIAGVTIVFSVLNQKIIKAIKRISKQNVENLVVSFEFLAFNVGVGIFIFFLIHFSLDTNLPLFNKYFFYILIVILTYFLFFIIFYSISLISNIVRIFYITNLYDEINTNDKNLYSIVNEIRIDFILNMFLSITKVEKEEFLRSLDDYVDASDMKDKEKIKNYFSNYYDG